ncbi:MAG: hypothetical protein H6581_20920 [Bacteroidia bacterium]|nr:hypothetical protein [Bacteroidia bacterium]
MGKGKQNKFNPRKSSSYQRERNVLETRKGRKEPLIVLSFKDFDRNQGQSFKEWEQAELLALAVNKLHAVCQLTVGEATSQQVIKRYTKVGFPPESGFVHPRHILPEVTWCSMHIQGKECVIGYFEENVFYVVFLDMDHEFWKTKKKHT